MSEAPLGSPTALPRGPSLAARAALAVALFVGFYVLALGIAAGLLAVLVLLGKGIGHVPVQIAVPCLFGFLAILWSIFPRFDRFRPPGPPLRLDDHPRLFARLRQISDAAEQRMPAQVFLLPDVNAWVAERGGILGLGRKRVMGLGLPLLAALSASELEAVVAHEFGHFYGGDTSLGPWVYRTRAAILRTIENLGDRQTRLLQAPFLSYGNFFLRITQSVSRSQEYAADALAARLVGGDALARGLVKIRRADLAYETFLQRELFPILACGSRPPLAGGFQLFLAAESVVLSLDKAIEERKAIEKPNPFDTHPTLRARLAALAQLPPGSARDGDEPAIALLDRTDLLEAELIPLMRRKIDPSKLASVAWSEIVDRVLVPAWDRERRIVAADVRGKTVLDFAAELAPRPGAGSARRAEESRKRMFKLRGAFALALRADGWRVESAVGEDLALVRGDRKLHLFRDLVELTQGKLDPEAWRERCRRDGIDAVDLSVPELPPEPPVR